MKKYIYVILLCTFVLQATVTVIPTEQIEVEGSAKDIVQEGDMLYIGTDSGKMQRYNYNTKSFGAAVKFPDIKDFMGDTIPTRVSSLDVLEGKLVMLTDSGIGGYANIWLHENNTTTKILSHKDKRSIVKVRWVDKGHILFGYLGNEAALYDIAQKKERYRVQLTPSKFSDFALNEDRSMAAFGCESGVISVIETQTGKTIKELSGINKDNTYKVAMHKGIVAAAGQDRRGAIYDLASGKGDFVEGSFLIYATGISPNTKKVAFAMDEQNNISIYNTVTKSKLYLLKGQKSTLNSILFIDEETVVSASDDNTVMLWKLK